MATLQSRVDCGAETYVYDGEAQKVEKMYEYVQKLTVGKK